MFAYGAKILEEIRDNFFAFTRRLGVFVHF